MIELQCADYVTKLWRNVVTRAFSKRLPVSIKVICFNYFMF